MNLPNHMGAKKKDDSPSVGYSLNTDIISDMKKKNLLNRINNKFGAAEALASKPAHELHDFNILIPPLSSEGGNHQRVIDEDELNELLNGVQPAWNIPGGGLRETTYVPTSTATGFEDDEEDDDGFRVYDNKARKNKMVTIREEVDEEHKSDNGSDTGYFSASPQKHYDSQDEEEFRKRKQKLYQNH